MIAQGIRIILITSSAFLIALVGTPLWLKTLQRLGFGKSIRTNEEAPVFSALHTKKSGTLNGAGVVIWGSVVLIAIVIWILGQIFDGVWEYLNFISRAETYLPLAALVIAGLLGFADDYLGAKKKGGGKGGGIQIRYKLVIYTVLGVLGAWWFYVRLGWDVITVPFLGSFQIGWWYIPIFIFIIVASAFSANETDGLDGLFGGVALFTFVALTGVAFALGRFDLAVMSGAIIGALLGITIGTIAMLTNTALFLPLFAIILVIESLSVILQVGSKKIFKKKVFRSAPVHHHLEAIGWPESQVTMRFWIISAMASALGLLLFFLSRFF